MGAKEDRKECYFRILGNYTKSYNKWYPDSENQEWTKSIGKGKYRGCARMVQFDHSCGTYKDVNSVSSQWAHDYDKLPMVKVATNNEVAEANNIS